ncbi:MAG: hypothetical protein OEY87_03400 [Gammaproteobacteria bacterium]|nr:hypothetical protein [Gammaproteobacteria bacterium]MDH5735148.1 hypothetical protein [Gammaproteobacteria bacterium]
MTLKNKLEKENQHILDNIEVLEHLIAYDKLRDNPVFCGLLKQLTETINDHLRHEGRSAYKELLPHKDNGAHEIANQFMNNTNQLHKIMNDYAKHWCKAPHDFKTNEAFIDETKNIFHLVTERINLEQKKLFPYIE